MHAKVKEFMRFFVPSFLFSTVVLYWYAVLGFVGCAGINVPAPSVPSFKEHRVECPKEDVFVPTAGDRAAPAAATPTVATPTVATPTVALRWRLLNDTVIRDVRTRVFGTTLGGSAGTRVYAEVYEGRLVSEAEAQAWVARAAWYDTDPVMYTADADAAVRVVGFRARGAEHHRLVGRTTRRVDTDRVLYAEFWGSLPPYRTAEAVDREMRSAVTELLEAVQAWAVFERGW